MNPYYPTLFSPLRVGNTILRNRMICPPSDPHYIQAGENFPSEATIMHYADRARGGAALVTVEGCGLHAFPPEDHHWGWDASLGSTQNAMSQLADAVHFYGSKINGTIMCFAPPGWDVSEGILPLQVQGDLADHPMEPSREMSREMLLDTIEQYARLAQYDKECGFDGVYIHMSYRMVLTGRMLSPLTNHRTDEFGGSPENRFRFPLMLCRRIKELCGQDFLIEASVSAEEKGGIRLEDTIRFAHAATGLIDMLQVRCGDVDPNHPIGFCPERTPFISLTEAVKKGAPDMTVVAVAGFFAPEDCENALKEGKADLIAMARAYISNGNYGELVRQGKRDELVPCIRCNKCHRSGPKDPWHSVCSVNPRWPLADRSRRLSTPSNGGKRVVIIGGGIAGMQAAEVCAQRGHSVTLYEKSGHLGGALRHAEYADFKWPMRDFLHYHEKRVQNDPRIQVVLECCPEPDALKQQQPDVLIAAVGAKVRKNIPEIASDADVLMATEAFGRQESLPGRLVIVGGGEIACETGLYLARCGHQVTLLAGRDKLAPEAYRVHYYSMFMEACEQETGLNWILNARCRRVEKDGVTYTDTEGREHRLDCRMVLLATGREPDIDEALRYGDCAASYYAIGDCSQVGNVQKAVRAAYDIACSI